MITFNSFGDEALLKLLKQSCQKESMFYESKRTRRHGGGGIGCEELVKPAERDEMVAFVLAICESETMALSVETFALCTSLVDRFLASFKVKSKYLECLSMACLYIACKIKEEDEIIATTGEFLTECECKLSVSELIRMEQMILAKFEWNVNDITAFDFLHVYCAVLFNAFEMSDGVTAPASALRGVSGVTCKTDLLALFKRDVCSHFVNNLEYKLKHCLCVSELSDLKPSELAFTIFSIELDNWFSSDSNQFFKENIEKTINLIKFHIKLNEESNATNTTQIKHFLKTFNAKNDLTDKNFQYFQLNFNKTFRKVSNYVSNVSNLRNQLEVIKEEDEYEKDDFYDKKIHVNKMIKSEI